MITVQFDSVPIFRTSSPPPIFSKDPESGVDVFDTVPRLSTLATLMELRELRLDNASKLKEERIYIQSYVNVGKI